jgi:hypothetical protein
MNSEFGRKNDQDKDPWHLAPWDAFRAIVDILHYGAIKYEPRNWEKGMEWSRPYSALMRHMSAWWEGERCDPESGKPHLWHAGCCIVFLIAYEIREIGKDNRPKTTIPEPVIVKPTASAEPISAEEFTKMFARLDVSNLVMRAPPPRTVHVATPGASHDPSTPPWLVPTSYADNYSRWYRSAAPNLGALLPWVAFEGDDDEPPSELRGFYTYQHYGDDTEGWLLEIEHCPSDVREYFLEFRLELNATEYAEKLTWERGLYEWIEASSHYRLKKFHSAWHRG